jgi:site-specific DNA-methyltransferase (adenine-specific)
MTESVSYHDGHVMLWHGDCLEAMAQMPENSIDSACCDPPYHLTSIVDQFALRRDVTAEQKAELYRWLSENA